VSLRLVVPVQLLGRIDMKDPRSKLTYANVMATVAVFLVLAGGSAFAASQMLPKNSVGPKQLKKGAVTPAKLSKAAKSALAGPRGAIGPVGPTGDRGEKGNTGEAGPFPTALPNGRTVVGVYDIEGTANSVHDLSTGAISYVYPTPGQQVEYLPVGATNPHCTGTPATPTAPPGFTCIYETVRNNISSASVNFSNSNGVGLAASSEATGNYAISGTWAATGK
jgi:hypothetical protein